MKYDGPTLLFHTQIHKIWKNHFSIYHVSFGISKSYFSPFNWPTPCLDLGGTGGGGWGREGGKVFRVRRRSLGTSTCSLRCSGRRLPFEHRWYSLCPHCPVITMPPKLKTLAVKGEERILSLGVLGRALKNCQLLKYTSQDPVFSSQYPTASQRAVWYISILFTS